MRRLQPSLHSARGLLLLGLAGCAEIPSLSVAVEVHAPEVRQIALLVVRESRAAALIDCTVGEGGALTGRCPFEEPDGAWIPGQPLAFVLYGEGGTTLELRAEGLDAEGHTVTTTRAIIAIPEDGSTAERRLVMPARTELRARCGLDLAQDTPTAEGQRDRTGLVVLDLDGDRTLELVAATPRRISSLRWSHDGAGHCALVETATIALDCTPRGGTLVTGELDPTQPGPEVAITCLQRSNSNRLRVAAWSLSPDGRPSRASNITIPYVLNQTTRAVIADLDGDGTGELSMLAVTSTIGPVVGIATWTVGETRFRQTPISGLRLASPTTGLTLAPLVIGGPRDALVVGGYRGGTFYVERDGSRIIDANMSTPPAALSGAAVERPGLAPRALFVRDMTGGTAILETALEAGGKTAVRPLADAQRTPGLASVALAVGDVDGAGEPSVVLAVDGFVQILALTSTSAPARRFPLEEPIDGAMVVLLADIDGAPGAEILAFQPKTGRVFAHGGDGHAVPGFPIEVGVPGPETRMIAADLDGDGALELIAISFDRVSVVSLGPRTHHPRSTPWPEAFHDGRGRSSRASEHDPRRP